MTSARSAGIPGVAADTASPAQVDEECPKCKHPFMEYYTRQLRSADEGQTIFYECPNCRSARPPHPAARTAAWRLLTPAWCAWQAQVPAELLTSARRCDARAASVIFCVTEWLHGFMHASMRPPSWQLSQKLRQVSPLNWARLSCVATGDEV